MTKIKLTRGERLKDLRCGTKLTHAQLSKAVGISTSSLSDWENEIKEPSVINLKRLAEYFNVSLDYLAGLSECPSSDIDIRAISDRTGLTNKSISKLEWLKKNRRDDVDFDLIDYVNYLTQSSDTDISMSVNALVKIPKQGKSEELELLEIHHVGNLYKRIIKLADKVRDDRESDEHRREEMQVIREKMAKRMREVIVKDCDAP